MGRNAAGEKGEVTVTTPSGPRQVLHPQIPHPFSRLAVVILLAPSSQVPAVHHGGPSTRRPVDVVPDSSHKLDQGLGGLRDSMVWPHRVVKVADESVCVELFLL